MNTRVFPRIPIHYPVLFSGDDLYGEGTVVDISEDGCAVGSDATVRTGTCLTLDIFLPYQDFPIMVDQAVVRWSAGRVFGVEFLRMEPGDWKRLHQFINIGVTVPIH